MKTVREIEVEIDIAIEAEEDGGIYHGMTYEAGVRAALEWVLGWVAESPMEG